MRVAMDNNDCAQQRHSLFVTEWGSVNASGDGGVNAGETAAWVDFMKRNNISNANWSLNDKAEGSSALVQASPSGNWVTPN